MFENMFENLNLTDSEIATLGKELSEIYADRIDECGGQYVLDICGAAMLGALFMQETIEAREKAKKPEMANKQLCILDDKLYIFANCNSKLQQFSKT